MPVVEVTRLTKAMQKRAYVEVECALPHDSAQYGGTRHCRYARGYVTHKDSGLVIKTHSCHECTGYFLVKATLPPEEQICDNCGGPIAPSGQESCWPSLLVVDNFVEPRKAGQ